MKLSTVLSGKWIKHPKPILYPGELGAWDDIMADCPSIFSDEPGKFYLYYTGHSTKTHKWSIGIAESDDLFNWVKYGQNPLLNSGDTGSWDQRIDGASVFKHNGKYYLFYEASSSFSLGQSRMATFIPYTIRKRIGVLKRRIYSLRTTPLSQAAEHAKGRNIGFASSDDMVQWHKYSGNPILKPSDAGEWDSYGVLSPSLQFFGDEFYMFYGGSDGQRLCSGVAISKDLFVWKRWRSPILVPGPKGAWDDSSVLIVSVVKLDDAYCAFYEGQDSLNNYAIGLAYSDDLRRWAKFEGNPVITKGQVGSPDEKYVNSPHGFVEGDRAYIFYGALDSKLRGRSMVAYLESSK